MISLCSHSPRCGFFDRMECLQFALRASLTDLETKREREIQPLSVVMLDSEHKVCGCLSIFLCTSEYFCYLKRNIYSYGAGVQAKRETLQVLYRDWRSSMVCIFYSLSIEHSVT